MRSSYSINEVSIKRPHSFRIEKYKVTNLKRLANADMSGALIAKKRKFNFTYNAITSTDLNKILDILWESDDVFYTLKYMENNELKTVTVYPGAIPAELHRTGNVWVWKDVSFSLIER